MRDGTLWKVSTFTALGLAGFLAFHPLGGADDSNAKGPAGTVAKKSHNGGILAWLSGGSSVSNEANAPHTGTHLVQLRAARNMTEECEALRVLSLEATGDEEAIGEIADRTAATHPRGVRTCAISALEKIPTAAARSYLGDLLNDTDTYIRDAALHSLAVKARDDADARSLVITAAHSEDEETRLEALIALGDAHIPEASALIQAALATETGTVRSRLVSALGETRDTAAVGAISKMVDDGSSDTRRAAIEALGSIGGDQAVTLLKDKLTSGSREDAYAAAQALAKTGDATAKQALLDATKSTRHDEQIAAIRALGRVEGEDVRTAMIAALHSSDPSVVTATSSWFSSHGDRTAVADIVNVLKTAPPNARSTLVSALAGIGGDDARDAIATMARTPGNEQVAALNQLANMSGGREEARKIALRIAKEGGQSAYSAVNILGQEGTPEARDALVTIAKNGGDVASSAMSALASNGDPEALRALTDLSRSAKTPELRSQAINALAQSGDPKSSATLVAAASDKNASVRLAAIAGLGRVGGPGAERALVDAASSMDHGSRMAAIRSLAAIHTPTATAEIEKLAQDTDISVQRVAFSTLVNSAPDRAAAIADRAMASGNADTRQLVVQNATSLAPEVSKRILTTAIRDSDDNVASSAIDGLALVGGHDAQQSLLDLLTSSSTSEATKRAAADALQRSASDMALSHSSLIDKYKSPEAGENGPSDVMEGVGDDDVD